MDRNALGQIAGDINLSIKGNINSMENYLQILAEDIPGMASAFDVGSGATNQYFGNVPSGPLYDPGATWGGSFDWETYVNTSFDAQVTLGKWVQDGAAVGVDLNAENLHVETEWTATDVANATLNLNNIDVNTTELYDWITLGSPVTITGDVDGAWTDSDVSTLMTNLTTPTFTLGRQVEGINNRLSPIRQRLDGWDSLVNAIDAAAQSIDTNVASIEYYLDPANAVQGQLEQDIAAMSEAVVRELADSVINSRTMTDNLALVADVANVQVFELAEAFLKLSPSNAANIRWSGLPYMFGTWDQEVWPVLLDLLDPANGGADPVDNNPAGVSLVGDMILPGNLVYTGAPPVSQSDLTEAWYPPDATEVEAEVYSQPTSFFDEFAWNWTGAEPPQPNLSFNVPLSSFSLGGATASDMNFDVDLDWYAGSVRTALFAAIMAFAGLWAAWMVFEEFRKT